MKSKCIVLMLAIVLSLCAGAGAATLEVGSGFTYANIQDAINAAATDDTILVHAGTYPPITALNKRVVIQEATGEVAIVAADPAVNSGTAVYTYDSGRAATWDGIDMIQNVAGGGGGHNVFVIFNNADDTTFTLSNCTISIDLAGGSVDARISGFGDRVHAVNVTFTRTDNNGNPGIFIFDGGGDSVIENCTFGPTNDNASGIIDIANPANQTLIIKGCTFKDMGAGAGFQGRGITASDRPQIYNISDTYFGGGTGNGLFATYAGNGASCPGTIFNFNRCKFDGAPASNWFMFYGDGEGAVTNFTNCVFINDAARELQIYSEHKAHTWVFKQCTWTETAPKNWRQFIFLGQDDLGNAVTGTYEFDNCLFNWPASNDVLVLGTRGARTALDGRITAGNNLFHMGYWNPDDALIGKSAVALTDDPQMKADGIHIKASSPAVDAGAAIGVADDIDGQPRDASPDLGADEVLFLEVGPSGYPYTNIPDALAAAVAGDTIRVHTGTYNQAGSIALNKAVDIIEANGETAVVVAPNGTAGAWFLIDATFAGTATWDGIDVVLDDNDCVRTFLFRGPGGAWTIKNVAVTDTANNTANGRVFAPEGSNSMTINNCSVNLQQAPSEGTIVAVSCSGGVVANDCNFAGKTWRHTWSETTGVDSIVCNRCYFEAPTGAWGVLNNWGGYLELNDCTVKTLDNGAACLQLYTAGGTTVCNRTVIDARLGSAGGFPVNDSGHKLGPTSVALTNCVLLLDVDNLPGWGNPAIAADWGMDVTMRQCTVAAEGPSNQHMGVMSSNEAGTPTNITLDNNIFYLPGSTIGAVGRYGGAADTTVTAGTNLRFVDNAPNDMLNGVIIDGDPLLAADLIHLAVGSPALEAGVDVGITTDIDSEVRPQPAATNPDLGADESPLAPGPHFTYLDVGPSGYPFTTIEDAMSSATSSGDEVIRVHTGTYTHAAGYYTWKPKVDIVEAPGETAVFVIPDTDVWAFHANVQNDAVGSYSLTWDGIDMVFEGGAVAGPFLIGNHSPGSCVITFNLKNCSFTDALTPGTAAKTIGYGILISYGSTINNIENVTVDCDNGRMAVGTIFATSQTDFVTTTVFNIRNTFVRTYANQTIPMLGGQGQPAIYNLTDSTFASFAGGEIPGTAAKEIMFFSNGTNVQNYVTNCTFIGRKNCYGLGIDNAFLVADQCVFDFDYAGGSGLAINAPRMNGWAHTFTNCAFLLGGGGWAANCVIAVPGPVGTLTMKHCTVNAATPIANCGLFFSQADAPYTAVLDNNIFTLASTGFGAIVGPGSLTGVTGTNLRCYAGATADVLNNDKLLGAGGTVIDVSEVLYDSDMYHLTAVSESAIGAPDIGITTDIDGDVRPAGPDPSNLKDPSQNPALPEFGADERADLPEPIPPAAAEYWMMY